MLLNTMAICKLKNAVFVKVENKDATIAVNPLENGAIDEIPSTIKKEQLLDLVLLQMKDMLLGKF